MEKRVLALTSILLSQTRFLSYLNSMVSERHIYETDCNKSWRMLTLIGAGGLIQPTLFQMAISPYPFLRQQTN